MEIKIKIDEAIAAMEENLRKHIIELERANKGWTQQIIAALTELRDAVDRKGLSASHQKAFNLFLSKPVDNRAIYSKYIGALKQAKLAGQEEFESDEDEYDRMFNDNWTWAAASKMTNQAYSSRN